MPDLEQDGPEWEIGRISTQLTWNILLNQIPGGDTIIYDRPWQGKPDDVAFRKKKPSYAYSPLMAQGRIFKVMQPIETDLTLFNSRYTAAPSPFLYIQSTKKMAYIAILQEFSRGEAS